ncbi:MAG: sulfotransferase [Nevskia sp.]|nr:sulfotransferase [Nevskia sp.]
MKQRALRKVFVVGCQRSGTSVMQSAIARAAGLYTLRETHYFVHLLGGQDHWVFDDEALFRRKLRGRLALMRARTYSELRQDMSELLGDPALRLRLRPRLTGAGYVAEFQRLMNAAASHYGTAGWLEKTPWHLPYLDIIRSHIPDARFIHVARNGEDVVASIIDGEMRHFEQRWFLGGLGYAVRLWNRAMQTHLAYAGQPGHLVLRHEDFVADPVQTLRRVLQFLDLPADAVDLGTAAPPAAAELAAAPWKKHWLAGPVTAQRRKFETLMSPPMQQWVKTRLEDYERVSEVLAECLARAGHALHEPRSMQGRAAVQGVAFASGVGR